MLDDVKRKADTCKLVARDSQLYSLVVIIQNFQTQNAVIDQTE